MNLFINYLYSFLHLRNNMDEFNYNQRRYINVINVNNGHPRDGKSVIMQMRQEMEQYKDQFHKVSRELRIQENKNADLRSKNWKAMEALNNTERLYQKVLKSQGSQPGIVKKQSTPAMDRMDRYRKHLQIQTKAEESQKTFLLNLFRDLLEANDIPHSNRAHNEWLDMFSNKVEAWKSDYKNLKIISREQSQLSDAKMEVLKKEVDEFKEKSTKCQKELSELQSRMETKEVEWKEELEQKENEKEEIRLKVICAVKNAEKGIKELEEKLGNEQSEQRNMENKILTLHGKLSDEEFRRKKARKKLNNFKERHELERNKLASEIESLRNCLETEKVHRQYLEDRILQMDQMIFNGQKTLQKKDDTIKILENQLEELEKVASLKAQILFDSKASQTESLELAKAEEEKLIKDDVPKTQRMPSFKNKNKKKRKKKQKHVF